MKHKRLGAILEAFADWPLGWVYAVHDKAGKIVYIGASEDLDERIAAHKSNRTDLVPLRTWLRENTHTYSSLSQHKTKRAMLDAEREAIELHKPRFNVRYNTVAPGNAPHWIAQRAPLP